VKCILKLCNNVYLPSFNDTMGATFLFPVSLPPQYKEELEYVEYTNTRSDNELLAS
jgi:hypothetical protein